MYQKKRIFCLFYRATPCVFLGLFFFLTFFHGIPGFKRTTSHFKTAEQCKLKLLYRRYWQLFRYMYHANANLFKLVSLSSLNSKKINNSYNTLTGWVSFAWCVISLYQASIVIHNFKYMYMCIFARETRWTKAVKFIPSPFNTKQQFPKFSFK